MLPRASTLVALFILAAPGCKKDAAPPAAPPKPAAPAATPPAPVAAPAPIAAPAPAPAPTPPAAPTVTDPRWIAGLPARAVTAKPGDVVFAAVPQKGSEMSRLSLYKVDSVSGTTATLLLQPFGEKVTDVPGALIHPVPAGVALKVGDVALGHTMFGAKHGRISKVEPGKTLIKILWINDPKEMEAQVAIAPPSGTAPLAWVHHKGEGLVTTRYLGFVIAESDQRVWILGGSGHVSSVGRADVRPAAIQTEFKEGQKVLIDFPGLQEATISKVVVPGLLYKAKREFMGKPMEKLLSFQHILEKP